MTECNACGACCDPVPLPYSKLQIELVPDSIAERLLGKGGKEWVRDDLTLISRREGLKRADWMREGGKTSYAMDGKGMILYTMFYECRWFDKEMRKCTNHDNRPDICRGYPQYDDWPDSTKALPWTCTYRADQGKPVRLTPPEWHPIEMTKKEKG